MIERMGMNSSNETNGVYESENSFKYNTSPAVYKPVSPRTIFKDKTVFKENYLPTKILHRDQQIKAINRVLQDVEIGSKPENMLITGGYGSGKTVIIRSICESLCKEMPKDVATVYVNCSESNTRLRIIRSALRQLGAEVKSGFSGDYYDNLFKETILNHKLVILILDEVDKFTERKDSESDELFYTLSRLVDNVTTILLTNSVTFESHFKEEMDARVRDTFRWKRIEFPDYFANQLLDIVEDRCKAGLNPDTYEKGILAKIAKTEYDRGGRARGAISLACRVAEVAEDHGHMKVEESDVKEAVNQLKQEQPQNVIRSLPPVERSILGYVSFKGVESMNKAYNVYASKIAPQYGTGRSRTVFGEYISSLKTRGLMLKKKHGRGRGKGAEVLLSVPPEIADAVRSSLQTDIDTMIVTPHPTAESVTELERI